MTQLVCVGKWVDVIDKVNITRKTLTSMCSVYIRRNKTWLLSYQKLFKKKKTITLLTVQYCGQCEDLSTPTPSMHWKQ